MSETLDEWFTANDPGSNVRWDDLSRVHDWRNYVPHMLRERWLFLDKPERAITHVMASVQADNENWE